MTTTTAAPATIYHPNIPLDLIVESPINPRKRFDQAALEELAETVRSIGITTPVTVREIETPAGIRFELASGHRRCRAARLAGLTEVPALVRALDDQQFVEVMHLENLQRADVEPLDEALAYEQLLAEGYDVPSLSVKLGKSPTYVASRVRLLALGEAGREAMVRGWLRLSHALELAKLPVATQNDVLAMRWNLDAEALERAARGDTVTDDDADADPEDFDEEPDAAEEFPTVEPDVPFRVRRWQQIAEPTLAELRHHLKRDVYRRLSTVPWALDDAELVPEAGACATCAKRSGCAPLLFAELDPGADACLDQACFEKKEEAHWQRERAERPVVDGTAGGGEAINPNDNTDWQERQERQRKENERQAKQEQEALARRRRGRDAAVRAVLEAVPSEAFGPRESLDAVLFTVVSDASTNTITSLFAYLPDLDTTPPEDGDGYGMEWRRNRVLAWAQDDVRTDTDIARALVCALIGNEALLQPYMTDTVPVRLERFAALFDVDYHAIAKEAEQSKPAKKKASRARRTEAAAASTPSTQPE